ncbi:MAG: YciI family protein [Gammaproteobacteria bacterium]
MAEHAPTVERYTQRQFLVVTHDGPGSVALRDEHLEGHLEHIERHLARYVVCGPMLKDGGPALSGSYFVVFADDEADARALLDGDPYLRCGMYARVDINEVSTAAGSALGGVIWESVEAVRAMQSAAGK